MYFYSSCGQLCSVIQSTFTGNTVTGPTADGGAIYADTPGNLTITNNVFSSNMAGRRWVQHCGSAASRRDVRILPLTAVRRRRWSCWRSDWPVFQRRHYNFHCTVPGRQHFHKQLCAPAS